MLGIDDPSLPPNSVVTASAWHPEGHTAAWAIDTLRELPDDRQENHQAVVSLSRDSGAYLQYLCPPLIGPGAIVLKLAYSLHGDYLLVARTNLKRSLVLVYCIPKRIQNTEPVAWRIFEHAILDFTWTQDHDFVVCGENGLLSHFAVDANGSNIYPMLSEHPVDTQDNHTSETILMHGLHELDSGLAGPHRLEHETAHKYDRLRYDRRVDVTAVVSTESKRLAMKAKAGWSWADLDGQLTALAFQPCPNWKDNMLLAVAFEEGSCSLFTGSSDVYDKRAFQVPLLTVHLSEGPALALAWSPDGDFLAVGGTELVQIWETDRLVNRSESSVEARLDSLYEPLITWRPDRTATGPRNGEHELDQQLTEPSLSWSADGESLSFAHDRQVSTPLHTALLCQFFLTDPFTRSPSYGSGRLSLGEAKMRATKLTVMKVRSLDAKLYVDIGYP